MNSIKLLELEEHKDKDGKLVAINNINNFPFAPGRIFFVCDLNKETIRGEHASKLSEFVIIALKGKVCVELNRGCIKYELILENPNKALYLSEMTWMKLSDFDENSLIMIIASKEYDKKDYIEDFDEYLIEFNSYVKEMS